MAELRRPRAGLLSDCGSRGLFSEHPGESESARQSPAPRTQGSISGRSQLPISVLGDVGAPSHIPTVTATGPAPSSRGAHEARAGGRIQPRAAVLRVAPDVVGTARFEQRRPRLI
jgi:hypothetical protein